MENNGDVPTTENATSDSREGAEWSDRELDDAPAATAHSVERSPATLSDDEMRAASVLFGLIILVFAVIGISLPQFVPEKQSDEFQNCVQIAGSAERLSCYDKAALSAAAPFKGGSPFSTLSRSDLEKSG